MEYNEYRQYGLWERYADLDPNEDLVYTVGISDYKKHWFFAQLRVRILNQQNEKNLNLDHVNTNGTYKFRLALASVHFAELQSRINNSNATSPPLFSSGVIGEENTIVRHGIHGLYNIDVQDTLVLIGKKEEGTLLMNGNNTIF
ncbi:hypothetical protein TSUD_308870 [Trifolium subterraneum]|nr:hypothetical protein TSUD_308870 [Trifolium subterraneum]